MSDRTESQISNVVPSFLAARAGKVDQSLVALRQYRTIGRLAVVQAMTPKEIKEKHGEGSVFTMPDDITFLKKGDSFLFVPLFFCTEFIKWRHRDDKSGDPIVERTYNPESEIARRSRDEKLRSERYGGTDEKPWKYSYQEHLNFIGIPYGKGSLMPVAISFSKGEFKSGRSFSSKICGRVIPGTSDTAPLWSQIWEFKIGMHSSKKHSHTWWGFDIADPEGMPFIQDSEAELFEQMHLEFLKSYQENSMGVDMSGESAVATDSTVVDDGTM